MGGEQAPQPPAGGEVLRGEQLRGEAEGRHTLAARLPADFGPPDELTELAETFNGLLARLEASVARDTGL